MPVPVTLGGAPPPHGRAADLPRHFPLMHRGGSRGGLVGTPLELIPEQTFTFIITSTFVQPIKVRGVCCYETLAAKPVRARRGQREPVKWLL